MKQLILGVLLFCSCSIQETTKTNIVLQNEKINTVYLNQIEGPEKALLSWYLYAYGNECDDNSAKMKCRILKEMSIKDECEMKNLKTLLQWFSNDILAVYKLKNCPTLPIKSAIQNSFDQIALIRKEDSLSINFSVNGLNTLEEKSWNITQTDTYLIKKNTLIKLNNE